jgi:hypothetical protein
MNVPLVPAVLVGVMVAAARVAIAVPPPDDALYESLVEAGLRETSIRSGGSIQEVFRQVKLPPDCREVVARIEQVEGQVWFAGLEVRQDGTNLLPNPDFAAPPREPGRWPGWTVTVSRGSFAQGFHDRTSDSAEHGGRHGDLAGHDAAAGADRTAHGRGPVTDRTCSSSQASRGSSSGKIAAHSPRIQSRSSAGLAATRASTSV